MMNRINFILLIVNIVLLNVNLFCYFQHQPTTPPPIIIQEEVSPPRPFQQEPPKEVRPKISSVVPGELKFAEIVKQLNKWYSEAPSIIEVGIVGRTQNNTEIPYLRIGKKTGSKVLIMAAIHGNEHLCCSVSMGCMGKLLANYMVDDEVTKLLRERDIFYIPVVCPESYMKNQRHDMGFDPNRNFNGPNLSDKKSIPSIQALKDFHAKHQFKAVMSCHNFGRVYLYPWGYKKNPSDKDSDYKRILQEMAKVSGYKYEQIHRQSAPPYYGYEADWFHSKGALAIVNEIGRVFVARPDEVRSETELNFKVIKIWVREAGR